MVKDLVELPVSSVSDSDMGGLGCFEVVLTGRFNICRAIGLSIRVFCAGISTLTAGWEGPCYPLFSEHSLMATLCAVPTVLQFLIH
jgi:hypothetical protein